MKNSKRSWQDREDEMDTLTKRLAGPSTAKAGMEAVDQSKVNDVIYKASEVWFPRVRLLTVSGK